MVTSTSTDNETKRLEILGNYITFIDDPRITLEVAKVIMPSDHSDNDNFEAAKTYFNSNLLGKEDEVDFPIKDEVELIKRCNEILTLFGEIDFYSQADVVSVIYKISLEKNRISYKFTQDRNTFFGNPELAMAFKAYESMFKFGSVGLTQLLNLTDNDYTLENGFYSVYEKIKSFTRGMIWTQSNVGNSLYEQSREATV